MIDEKIHGQAWEMPVQVLCVFLGCAAVYSSLFAIGSVLYGESAMAIFLGAIAIVTTFFMFRLFSRLKID